jgi:hypothetical protein
METGDVRHLLLIPTDATRKALLGDGPCGARVPVAWWDDHHEDDGGQMWCEGPVSRGFTHQRALALAWDGRSTGPEGLARALTVLRANGCHMPSVWLSGIVGGLPMHMLQTIAEAGEARSLWRMEVVYAER